MRWYQFRVGPCGKPRPQTRPEHSPIRTASTWWSPLPAASRGLGKQKRICLGKYPTIGLRQARTLCDEARALLAKGINPHTDRKQRQHALKLASDYTKAVFDTWVEHRAKELKEGRNSTPSHIKRIFPKDILPAPPGGRFSRSPRPTCFRCCAREALIIAEKRRS